MWRETFGDNPCRGKFLSAGSNLLVFSILLSIFHSAPALAEVLPGSYSVTPFVGGYLFEGNQDLEHRPVYGMRLGYNFTSHWGAEAVLDYGQTNYKVTDRTTDVFNYRLEGVYHLLPNRTLVPFLAIGIGGMSIDSRDDAIDKNRATFDYGAGLKYSLTDRLAIRADIRHVLASGSVYNNLEYTVGLTFSFGGSTAAAAPPGQETSPAMPRVLAAPDNLTATPVSDSRIDLDWRAAAGAAGYNIYRDGSPVATARTTAAPDIGLQAATRYCYTVSAIDGAGRESGRSNQACATTLSPAASVPERQKEAAAAATPKKPYELEDIHFDFDKFNLKPEARAILRQHAVWLNKNSGVTLAIIVEGHCDERGTAEYNLALGERRANAAAKYLIDLGVDARRITTISYGFERPVDPRHTEDAWAKNRRAHFIVTDAADSKK